MSRLAKVAIALLIGAPLIALAIWIASFAKWTESERTVDFHGEAQRNSLLALQRLLEAMGVETVGAEQYDFAPTGRGVMFWRASGRFASPAQLASLRHWVESGGHLVLLLPSDRTTHRQIRDDMEAGRFRAPLSDVIGYECSIVDDAARDLYVDVGFGPRDLRLDRDIVFEDVDLLADFAVPDPYEARIAGWRLGAGRFTVVASDEWLDNSHLGDRDHARLAWDLARIGETPTKAWVVRGEAPSGLIATIARSAWMVVASLAALTALAIWRAAARFGPPLPDEPNARRDFSEHVVAAAEVLVRFRMWTALLAAPRRKLARALARSRPDLAALAVHERGRAIEESTGWGRARVERALGEAEPKDAADFVATLRDVEQLRETL